MKHEKDCSKSWLTVCFCLNALCTNNYVQMSVFTDSYNRKIKLRKKMTKKNLIISRKLNESELARCNVS